MMSAGSPRRSRSQIQTTPGCHTVSPQHVADPTILDQVSGFINEVATYNVPSDNKDQIQWARFEQLDSDAMLDNGNGEKVIPSSLILVLGYTTGVQVWAIPVNGEAVELLSWRHGAIRVLRILPTPYIVGHGSSQDEYPSKRPLMVICDTTTPAPHHCALNFFSLKTGEQVKIIKFKNPVLDVLANRRSVVVTFSERIAIFDAFTLEDRLTVTTCYLSPGIYPNPIALGSRWMAYAENKLITSKRSNGGNEGEAVQVKSYTATVLHAAKSLGKGLRELGETVASSLTGNSTCKPGTSPGNSQILGNNVSETSQKGVVTVLDIENQVVEDKGLQAEGVIAHFVAHTEAVVCLSFDPSGLLLLTADKRGHDFYLFRINPHPGGPSLSSVHHLYILHRGDTTARVQDMCFSPDSRWVAVSTLRGTTHVFPITPYGGNIGVRTHATPHVVNRMSRFHRSAGLAVEGRSNSPVSSLEMPVNSNLPYNNPRLPPYPHPTIVHPLEQIRLFAQCVGNIQQRPLSGRPRLNSSSEDNIQVAHRLSCCFAPPRAWFENATPPHEMPITKQQAKPVESLFVMSCHGTLLQYDLDPHPVPSVPKEKVCDETPIVLTVQAKAQWILQRQLHSTDIPLPVPLQNLNLLPQDVPLYKTPRPSHTDDGWLSQVEILTHAGPHRRLWMGPQFQFKTYTTNSSPVSLNEIQTVDVSRSKPVNMPVSTTYPILIESGSVSSCEQSPKLLETYQRLAEEVGGAGESQLKEDLADAMLESPGIRESGGRCVIVSMKPHTTCVAKVVNPLGTVVTIHSDEDNEIEVPEDAVIHENCDEALFRPVVTPKPVLYTETKFSHILSKPAFKTPNTVSDIIKAKPVENVKKEVENGKRNKNLKIHENDDIDQKEEKGKSTFSSDVELKTKNKNSKNKSEIKVDLTISKIETNIKNKEQIVSKTKPSKKSTGNFVSKVVESNVMITEPPLVISENVETISSFKSIDINPNVVKPIPVLTSKKSKTKSNNKASILVSSDKDNSSDGEKLNLLVQDEFKKSEMDQPVLKALITTPDLLDSVDTFDFPLPKSKKDKIQNKEVLEFPLLSKNEDFLKEDKFEDARDTDELLESFTTLKIEKEAKQYKSGKYQGLEPDEIVFSSEEEKTTNKKPRKPKAKLGVRLSKNKEASEKDNDNCSVEITIAAPRKAKSNVISLVKEEEKVSSILDLPEIDKADSFTLDMPKKSYSTVAKQNLFEIDPHEDVCDENILLPEPVYKSNDDTSKKAVEDDFGLLKIDKSSDDEKQENCSSQTETTESDDSTSKAVAMDTEEDNCQPEITKSTRQGSEKTVRCKSKKKKR